MVAALAMLVLIAIILAGLFAPLVSPHDPYAVDMANRLKPPGSTDGQGNWYLLGTDALGRDLLSRLIHGSRVSIIVMLTVVPVSAAIGVAMGVSAGYFGGWVDSAFMRLVDIRLSVPFVLILLAIMAVVGPSLRNLVLVLGLTGWADYARLVRAETMSIKQRDYIMASQASGASRMRIMIRHIVPNIMPIALVISTLQVPFVIVIEAALSFLGLGIQPPTPSWGNMLAAGREYIWMAWWLITFPGIAISTTVLSANIMGDRLRDLSDPHTRLR